MARRAAGEPRSTGRAEHRRSLSDQIRDAIAAAELSGYAVAKGSGLNPSVVNRWLAGDREILSGSLDRIADFLGLGLETRRRRGGR